MSRFSQRQSAWVVRRMCPRLRPFSKAFASISGLPSAVTTSNPASTSCTEWKPVPAATSSTRFAPRSFRTWMKKSPSLLARLSQSINSSHLSTKDVTYSAR